MTQMIRKQIYIQKRQDIQLKRMAKARGVSEAEIIREAIDHTVSGSVTRTLHPDPEAFEQLFQHMLARGSLAGPWSQATGTAMQQAGDLLLAGGEPYQWNRADAYEERSEKLASRHQH